LYRPHIFATNLVSSATVEKKSTKAETSSFERVMSEKERESMAMDDMFRKAKRLEGSDDEGVPGESTTGNTDGGFNDDDWD
jgi:hypothetical protein